MKYAFTEWGIKRKMFQMNRPNSQSLPLFIMIPEYLLYVGVPAATVSLNKSEMITISTAGKSLLRDKHLAESTHVCQC